ncbi:MAG: hypothetical protein ABGY29_16260 [bacterium]
MPFPNGARGLVNGPPIDGPEVHESALVLCEPGNDNPRNAQRDNGREVTPLG